MAVGVCLVLCQIVLQARMHQCVMSRQTVCVLGVIRHKRMGCMSGLMDASFLAVVCMAIFGRDIHVCSVMMIWFVSLGFGFKTVLLWKMPSVLNAAVVGLGLSGQTGVILTVCHITF